jgi:pyruvate dehydrogenase E2 component (dihydrolipoamide acetyltransferase)
VAYEFKLPDLGEGLTEGEVSRWLVAEGDEIAEDAPRHLGAASARPNRGK